MKRRDFLISAFGTVAALSLPVSAQQAGSLPVIGFLNGNFAAAFASQLAAFKAGLEEGGYVEGRNVAIEYRWAEGNPQRLPELLAELIQRKVVVITLTGAASYAGAVELFEAAAVAHIPVVSTFGRRSQAADYVDNLSRPGGNVTGFNLMTAELDGKRLNLLHDLIPAARTIAILVNPNTLGQQVQDAQEAASPLGISLKVLQASSADAIDAALANLKQEPADALLVSASPFFNSRREQILRLVAEIRIPAIYEVREFAVGGGLMSYGVRLDDGHRQLGRYVAQVLDGTSPAELPVIQSTSFDLVVNLKAAKALGLSVPPLILAIADEVIE